MLALLAFEYCVYPLVRIDEPSESHPSTKWRLHIISDYLKKPEHGGWNDFRAIGEEEDTYLKAWHYKVQMANSDPVVQDAIVKRDKRVFEELIQPLADKLVDKVSSLPLSDATFNAASSERCIKRLKMGAPIGAQGKPRPILQKALESYRQSQFSEKERVSEFQKLVSRFNETPMGMSEILVSSNGRRQKIINEYICRDDLLPADLAERVCEELTKLDELIVGSIQSSSVCNTMIHI